MTLRELLEPIRELPGSIFNGFLSILHWIEDWAYHLARGQILDLTIGQALFTLYVLFTLLSMGYKARTDFVQIRSTKDSIKSIENSIGEKKELGYETDELETQLEELNKLLRYLRNG